MTIIVSFLAFVLLLTVLVLIHEWGHYKAAKLSGVEVEEFGFGLPPKAKKLWHRDGTDFTINWIPFGGFVRLKGENAVKQKERMAKGSFASASLSARCFILVAGVVMNLLLALVLLTYGFSVGKWVPTYMSIDSMQAAADRGEITLDLAVMIGNVIADSPAGKQGIPEKSLLVSVNDTPVSTPDDVLALQEGKRAVRYTVVPLLEDGSFGEEESYRIRMKDGKVGVGLRVYPKTLESPQRPLLTAMLLSVREARVMTVQTVVGIGRLFSSLASSGRVPEGITGIVGIAQLTHASVQEGWSMYLRLVALLSLSLAVLNILPFPALDGGRLLFVLAEAIARKPLNRNLEITTNTVGFIFLLLLILVITFYDILRLF